MKKLLGWKSSLIICGLVFCVLAVVTLICPPYYAMNDDVMMKSILSGAYTGVPDGHAVYMKYPLTGLIGRLYRVTGRIPWFDLVLTGSLWAAVSTVMNRVLQMVSDKGKERKLLAVAAAACLCMALFLPQVLTPHYTLVAAIVGSCALFLALSGGGYLWVLLLILCYCIRSQIFFLTLPFLAVAVLWRLICLWKKKEREKKLWLQLAALAAGILICMLWNGLMYRSSEWQQYLEYNESRTRLYDYEGLLPYKENAEAFAEMGIDALEHALMDRYALALDGSIQGDTFEQAAELAAEQKGTPSILQELVYYIREYYYYLRYTDTPYNLLVALGYLIVIGVLVRRKCYLRGLLAGCMAGGRSLIWVYLIWRGRFPERVYVSLCFLDMMILAAMLAELYCEDEGRLKTTAKPWAKYLSGVLGGLLCTGLLMVGVGQLAEMGARTQEKAASQKSWEALVDYCEEHTDTTFLLDVYSVVDYSDRVWTCSQQQENYFLAGGWMSGSPLLKGRLGSAADGGELLAQSVSQRDCSYVIASGRDVDWLQKYCSARFGGLLLEKYDTVCLDGEDIFDVYHLVAGDGGSVGQ